MFGRHDCIDPTISYYKTLKFYSDSYKWTTQVYYKLYDKCYEQINEYQHYYKQDSRHSSRECGIRIRLKII